MSYFITNSFPALKVSVHLPAHTNLRRSSLMCKYKSQRTPVRTIRCSRVTLIVNTYQVYNFSTTGFEIISLRVVLEVYIEHPRCVLYYYKRCTSHPVRLSYIFYRAYLEISFVIQVQRYSNYINDIIILVTA